MEVRLDNAKARGIPLPPEWVTALRSLKAGEICRGFANDVRSPNGICNVSCRFLGVPKICALDSQDVGAHQVRPGVCLPLVHANGRKNYILVAPVENHEWLCHPGSFIGDRTFPRALRESDLVLKDVQREAWNTATVHCLGPGSDRG